MEYLDTVKYHGVPQDAIMCRLFTLSLRDDARAWYRSLPSRSYSWNEISRAFLDKYSPLHKQSAIQDEIFNFVQREGESLYDAWETYKALFRRCPNHGLERWLEMQIFYRGLTSDTRAYVDMAAGGAITNKTLDEAFLLIESIAFHQLQWYNKKPMSNSLVCSQQITTPQPPILTQKPEPLSQCDKVELAWIIFDDDDTILVDTHATDHLDTSVGDSVLHCDDSSMDELELQFVTFDIEESPLVDIDHVLLEPDMEKFAFDDVSRIDSSTLEPEMECFMVDYGEVDSDVKESSSISLVDMNPVEISTTTPHLVSSMEVVLKLLPNYLRLMLVYHLLRVDRVRDDIPWDPGGLRAWG
ncbi:uncharacterized protein [Triticum aestivum]|uniref:uncharacterized protein n=1 Tax=Triticum aestivum TaxID=4565 RepID=UPI001D026C46|nr:uncharacterized protein LOC123162549 [Triticum aestivum]